MTELNSRLNACKNISAIIDMITAAAMSNSDAWKEQLSHFKSARASDVVLELCDFLADTASTRELAEKGIVFWSGPVVREKYVLLSQIGMGFSFVWEFIFMWVFVLQVGFHKKQIQIPDYWWAHQTATDGGVSRKCSRLHGYHSQKAMSGRPLISNRLLLRYLCIIFVTSLIFVYSWPWRLWSSKKTFYS